MIFNYIFQNFFEKHLKNLDGFDLHDDNFIKDVYFDPDGKNKRLSDDKKYLELFYKLDIKSEEIKSQGLSLIMGSKKSLELVCKYLLEKIEITEDINIHQAEEIEMYREMTGHLNYEFKISDEPISAGERLSFSIEPVNPGVVYSNVESCEILSQDKSVSYKLT